MLRQLVGADGEAIELRQQAERNQFVRAMRRDVDADAEFLHFCGCELTRGNAPEGTPVNEH